VAFKSNSEIIKERTVAVLKSRCFYLGVFVVACMSFVGGRLYTLQLKDGGTISKDTGTSVTLSLEAPRGNIYDRNGILLATDRQSYKVQMTYVSGYTQKVRNEMYLNLVELFDLNGDVYTNTIGKYITPSFEWGEALAGDEKSDERDKWINGILIKKTDKEFIVTAKDAFEYLCNVVFEFDENFTDEQAYKVLIIRYETFKYGLSSLTPMTIATDVCDATAESIAARALSFPGIYTEGTYFREYLYDGVFSHVLGYARGISSEEYSTLKEEGYETTDIIGKTGIEKVSENALRGTKGLWSVQYDAATSSTKTVSYTDPIKGDDVYLTIDLSLQQVAMNSLKNTIQNIADSADGSTNFGDAKCGSVVVFNPKTGEILTDVSYPTYDNNLFLEPSSNTEAQKAITDLFSDPDSPSLNRVTQGLYAIGSTFKPIVAISGLEGGTLTPGTEYTCNGSFIFSGKELKCTASHGTLNLEYAIANSCNVYFQRTGVKAGISEIDKWAKAFGLGELTGIEIEEYSGYRSNETTMNLKDSDKSHIWSDADTAQTSIGQLYTLFTPLQICRYASALGNGGYLNTPYLVGSTVSSDGSITNTQTKSLKVDVKDSTLNAVRKGMTTMTSINESAKEAFKNFPSGFVAAKTGTPETGMEQYGSSSNAVFMCYAPADDPVIAIAIVIEHGVWGRNCIPIAGDILREYFSDYLSSGLITLSQGGVISTITNSN